MKLKWTDGTSWSRRDKDRSTPRSWEADADGLRIVVTRLRRHLAALGGA